MTSWAAFSFHGRSKIEISHGKQNVDTYCMILDRFLHPSINIYGLKPHNVYFQPDNAFIHTTRLTEVWLRLNFVVFFSLACLFA